MADWLTQLGLQVLPYSFAMYFPVRWLEYIWDKGYTRLVKGLWYLALGLTYVAGTVGAETIVTYICFIEACDLFFQQREVGRDRRRTAQASQNGALNAGAYNPPLQADTERQRSQPVRTSAQS